MKKRAKRKKKAPEQLQLLTNDTILPGSFLSIGEMKKVLLIAVVGMVTGRLLSEKQAREAMDSATRAPPPPRPREEKNVTPE